MRYLDGPACVGQRVELSEDRSLGIVLGIAGPGTLWVQLSAVHPTWQTDLVAVNEQHLKPVEYDEGED